MRWGRSVAGSQGPVCVLAGCPVHKALKGWGHGRVQAFGGEARVEGVGKEVGLAWMGQRQ